MEKQFRATLVGYGDRKVVGACGGLCGYLKWNLFGWGPHDLCKFVNQESSNIYGGHHPEVWITCTKPTKQQVQDSGGL